MTNCAIVGINWGDEGKGRMVDLLTEEYDVVVRYQGGGNAGHTVVNEKGKFALHLLPSGIFRDGVMNILGNGTALDPENLLIEMNDVRSKGVELSPENIRISERASLLMPWHRIRDGAEEARLADKMYGSTQQGIAPFYSDKTAKKTILAGELFYPEELRAHLKELLTYENLILGGVYGHESFSWEALEEWLGKYCEPLKSYICDTGKLLEEAMKEGKNILFEAQLGALKDLDFGICPYTTSSNTLAAYAPIGSGVPSVRIDKTVGVVKAYSTCVGEGPFVSEMFGQEADTLRETGEEYGAKTGRSRRVGALDLVATRYGVRMQAATEIAFTKLDILSYMERIPICVRYRVNGAETDDFPFPVLLEGAEPVIEYMPGWGCDISSVRRWEDLPKEARDYVEMTEKAIGVPITYISVGAGRDELIRR
ncbi:MAG: adenylosuccinate synthase [Eubacteriaceae bacterium]|nr:adenylosuccinate synthase [Eubacteriaceae bacterium]